MYCQVIVDIANEEVDRFFTYRLPAEMSVLPGTRVLIPFGKKRQAEGIVIHLIEKADIPDERIRDIIKPLDSYPVILPQLLELAEDIKKHSFCTLTQALRLMYPAKMRKQRIHEKIELQIKLLVSGESYNKALAENKRAKKNLEILRVLNDANGQMAQSALYQITGQCKTALNGLQEQQLIEISENEIYRTPYKTIESLSNMDPSLTDQQERVMAALSPALKEGKGEFLLYGVTGSGKTEIFIRAVRQVAQQGKCAIVLVPEISLTPQMIQWFRSRFGEEAAVLHSRLSDGEKYDEWRRIRKGEARVVIGARSAIFAPIQNLGLVIIDEEHEQSYISDRTPYYDARQIGMDRCKRENSVLILASATPSMRSFAQSIRGDLRLLEMPERVNDRPLPPVHIIDMRKELTQGNRSVFSGALLTGLTQCIQEGHQAILFVNRRGFSTFVSCRNCGYVIKCEHCDVSMTYHSVGNRMRCHYCGSETPVPDICPECGSAHIKYFGVGTQRVENEIQMHFPGISTLRMDIDTTRTKDAHAILLERFRRGEARVLIGTQMIAKGLDFPNVSLVGIMAADATLNLPDYRAPERTFQLLTQVAGRAGRASVEGEVFLQTYQPENDTILAASRQDYRAFYESEMLRRRKLYYPPYSIIIRNVYESAQEEKVQNAAERAKNMMIEFFDAHVYLKKYLVYLRSLPCPVLRIADKYRWEIIMSIIDKPICEEALSRMSEIANAVPEGVASICQINPSGMM